MYAVSMLTQETHPPVPLKDTDGAILKWPDLETATGEAVTEKGYPVARASAAGGEEE
jgi:hypothetical protein